MANMKSVLVIDDEPLVRKTIRLVLEQLGYEVQEAETGVEGIKLAGQRKFDLVITDILMPDMDGLETIINLKSASNTPKLLAISGGGRTKNTEFLNIAEKLGADDTLKKPFDLADLRVKVQAMCA